MYCMQCKYSISCWAGRIHQNYTNQSAIYIEIIDTMFVQGAELPGISRLGMVHGNGLSKHRTSLLVPIISNIV